jgi:hypothetical protein
VVVKIALQQTAVRLLDHLVGDGGRSHPGYGARQIPVQSAPRQLPSAFALGFGKLGKNVYSTAGDLPEILFGEFDVALLAGLKQGIGRKPRSFLVHWILLFVNS